METAIVGRATEGFPLHVHRAACAADHLLVCNRVKPHTSLAGDFQSGLLKMLLIGLGKQTGAHIYHRAIEDYGFDRIVRSVAREVIEKCHIVAGLAVVENAYDETALIEAVEPRGSRPANRSCWPWPGPGWPACRSTPPTCC